jgi:hypothetical protein
MRRNHQTYADGCAVQMICVIFKAGFAADFHVLHRHYPTGVECFAERDNAPAAGGNGLAL